MKKSMMALGRRFQIRKKQKAREDFYYRHLYTQQSNGIRIVQFYFARIFILGGSFLAFILFSSAETVYPALVSAIAVLLLYHLIAKSFENKRIERVVREIKGNIQQEEFWKRIKGYDKEGFLSCIEKILSDSSDYTQVKRKNLESDGIHLVAQKDNQLIAIQCHLLDEEDMVEARYVRELSRAMSSKEYKKGLIISTTDFRQASSDFCNLIKEKREIRLINDKKLYRMAQDAGHLPTEEEVNDLLLKRIENQQRSWQETQSKLFAKPRALPYFFYGTFLIAINWLFDVGMAYLYYGGAFFLYSLGIISLVYSFRSRKIPLSWKKY